MRCRCRGGVVLSALLMVQQVAAVERGPAGNGTDDGGGPSGGRDGFGDGDGGRDTRRADPQRGQRCSVQPVVASGGGGGGGYDDDGGGTLLETTRTVDRYRVKPAVQVYYEAPVVYRRRPEVAVAYVRRRRPVAVVQDRPQVLLLPPKPEDAVAAVRYHYGMPAADGGDTASRPLRPVRIELPPPSVPVPDEDHRPAIGEPLVSLTADQVRRVLQRMFSEGVTAGEAAAAAAGPKFIKV